MLEDIIQLYGTAVWKAIPGKLNKFSKENRKKNRKKRKKTATMAKAIACIIIIFNANKAVVQNEFDHLQREKNFS